jgi:hypothetical protein
MHLHDCFTAVYRQQCVKHDAIIPAVEHPKYSTGAWYWNAEFTANLWVDRTNRVQAES